MSATMRRDASGSGHRTGDASISSTVTVSTSTPSNPMSVRPIDWVKLKISTPNWPSSLRATPPAATRVAVSRAEERSRTLRTSAWPYLSAPARSACPGRSLVTALAALAAGEVATQVVLRDRKPGGQAFDDHGQLRTVGFAGREPSEH